MNPKDLFKLSSLPIFIASLCCIAPIILVLFGISSVAFAASLTNLLDGQYRWAFVLVGLATLVTSLVIYFRKSGICTIDQAVRRKNEIINKSLIILIITAVGYILFFDYFLGYIGKLLKIWD